MQQEDCLLHCLEGNVLSADHLQGNVVTADHVHVAAEAESLTQRPKDKPLCLVALSCRGSDLNDQNGPIKRKPIGWLTNYG